VLQKVFYRKVGVGWAHAPPSEGGGRTGLYSVPFGLFTLAARPCVIVCGAVGGPSDLHWLLEGTARSVQEVLPGMEIGPELWRLQIWGWRVRGGEMGRETRCSAWVGTSWL
jgi:hypothetical protein